MKTHKRLKAELEGNASKRQCKRAKQRLAQRREQEITEERAQKVYIVGGVNTR